MSNQETGGLYSQVLKTGGVVGLIAIMTVSFIMWVVYTGQKEAVHVHLQMVENQKEQTEILKDIRYSLKANNGVVFRNEPQP